MNLSFQISNNRLYRIAVSGFFFIAGISFATWASRIPDIKEKLQLSDAGLGAVLLSLPVGLMLSLPISGWLITKYGSRRMLLTAALFYPAVLVFLGLADSVLQLSFTLFLFGLLGNLINIAMNTQAVAVEKFYGRSIMASFHGLWSLAGFSGAAIGSFLVTAGVVPFWHFTIIWILTLLLVLVFYKYTVVKDDASAEAAPLFVKPDRYILILGLIAFCSMMAEGAMADWSGVYFKNIVAAPKAVVTIGYVAFTAAMAGGRFLADGLATKFGMKNILKFSGALITAGLVLSTLFPYVLTSTIGFLLVGLGVSSVVPFIYSLAGKSTTMSPGLALAAVSSVSFLGFLSGPPIIGFIAQAINLRGSFAVIALLGLGIVVMSNKIKND
ncbi:MAG: MFS transporter [Sphingobacteriales bacterium]|nr:MFS transporter [Sphingobacteriales bacterium]MBI3719847.1 MFS transporter [Sphingobacteriales bacterium]